MAPGCSKSYAKPATRLPKRFFPGCRVRLRIRARSIRRSAIAPPMKPDAPVIRIVGAIPPERRLLPAIEYPAMTLDTLRQICRALPGVTEDIKWGADLAFSVGGRMFCVAGLEPPHPTAFKCTPEEFGELVERPGLVPAPYLADRKSTR